MFELQTRPFSRFFDLDNDFEKFFGQTKETKWKPHSDITETENDYKLSVDLPGVKKEDVNIDLKNDVLTVTSERKFEVNEDNESIVHREKFYGKYERSFRLPKTTDQDNIIAALDGGVLSLTVPKKEKEKSKQIIIK